MNSNIFEADYNVLQYPEGAQLREITAGTAAKLKFYHVLLTRSTRALRELYVHIQGGDVNTQRSIVESSCRTKAIMRSSALCGTKKTHLLADQVALLPPPHHPRKRDLLPLAVIFFVPATRQTPSLP